MVQTAAIFATLALAGTVAALPPPRIGVTVPNKAPFQPGPHGITPRIGITVPNKAIPVPNRLIGRDVDTELEARFGGHAEHGHGPVQTRIGIPKIVPFFPNQPMQPREEELEARGGAGAALKVGVKVAEKLPEVGHAIHSFWDKHVKHKSRNVDFDDELFAREVDELEARGGAGAAIKIGVKVAEHAPDVGHAVHSFWDKHVSHKARDLDFEDNLFARDDYELEARKGGKGGGHGGSAISTAVTVAENAPGVISGVKGWWNKHVSHKARDLDFEDDLFARDEESLEARDEDVEALFARYYEELDQLE